MEVKKAKMARSRKGGCFSKNSQSIARLRQNDLESIAAHF
jgi:hypothetical protein